ncbi:hypothetical protein AMC87_CH01305 [Rhizobium phaseoli]|nr:hypothetical protein AMC87_CH01305 [Rhizobium phaseoli]
MAFWKWKTSVLLSSGRSYSIPSVGSARSMAAEAAIMRLSSPQHNGILGSAAHADRRESPHRSGAGDDPHSAGW